MKLWILSLLFLFSCSHKKIREEAREVPTDKIENIDSFVKTLSYDPGPSKGPYPFFAEKTESYGLLGVKASHLYAVDFDQDGATDLVTLPDFYSIPEFYRFLKNEKRFVPLAYSPLTEVIRASYLVFVDYNRDGTLDLVAGTLNQKSELLKEPIRFFKGAIVEGKISYTKDETVFKGIPPWPTASLSFLDADLDGDLDLFLGNWFDFSTKELRPAPDKLYFFQEDKYVDKTPLLIKDRIKERRKREVLAEVPTYGVSVCDIDQNGFPDILTASSGGHPNRLWMNLLAKDGEREFLDYGVESRFAHDQEGELSLVGGGNTLFALCADYNNDGFMDTLLGELSHAYDPITRDRSSILTGGNSSIPPYFIRTEYYREDQVKNWDQGDRRGVWFDYNSDGLLDFIVENSGFPPASRLILFEQALDHSFEEKSSLSGIDIVNPSGPVVLDLNGDGLLDLIVGQTNVRDNKIIPRLYVFENQVRRSGNRSLSIHLFPTESNRDAIGAMVILKTDRGLKRRFIEYSSGPLPSQNEKVVHFGLGAEKPLSVEVRWPYLSEKARSGGALTQLKQYDISSLNYHSHYSVALCESGKWKSGTTECK